MRYVILFLLFTMSAFAQEKALPCGGVVYNELGNEVGTIQCDQNGRPAGQAVLPCGSKIVDKNTGQVTRVKCKKAHKEGPIRRSGRALAKLW